MVIHTSLKGKVFIKKKKKNIENFIIKFRIKF